MTLTDEVIKVVLSQVRGLHDDNANSDEVVLAFARAIEARVHEELRKQVFDAIGIDISIYTHSAPIPTPSQEEAYKELIYAVARKFPNETRHQTALRYIMQAEEQSNDAGKATDARPDAPIPTTGETK